MNYKPNVNMKFYSLVITTFRVASLMCNNPQFFYLSPTSRFQSSGALRKLKQRGTTKWNNCSSSESNTWTIKYCVTFRKV